MTDALFDIAPGAGNGCSVPDHLKPQPRPREAVLALSFSVKGSPAPQGSKKGFYNKHLGRVQMVEMSAKVKPWRDAVRSEAVVACAGAAPLDGPLRLDAVFTFRRPKSHYRTGRNAHLLRDDAPIQPIGAPDLSKLVRSTEDALKDGGAYVDDARICSYGRIEKVWANEDPDALDSPGAVIRIYQIGATA